MVSAKMQPLKGHKISNDPQTTDLNQRLFQVINDENDDETTKITKIRELLAQGADLNAQEQEFSNTLLHFAIIDSYLKIFKFLFRSKAKMDIPNDDYDTALDLLALPSCKAMRQIYDDLNMDLYNGITPIKSRVYNIDDGSLYNYLDPVTKKLVKLKVLKREDPDQEYNNEGVLFSIRLLMIYATKCSKTKGCSINSYVSNYKFFNRLSGIPYQMSADAKLGVYPKQFKISYVSNKNNKITIDDLINIDRDSPFSLIHMYNTFRDELDSECAFITNADFGDLGNGIKLKDITNKAANLIKIDENTKTYKLIVDKHHQLYTHLKEHISGAMAKALLIKALAPPGENRISLLNALIARKHLALANLAIDVNTKKFKDDFINNQNLNNFAASFRETLKYELIRIQKVHPENEEEYFKNELQKIVLNLTPGFGKKWKPKEDVKLSDMKAVVREIISAIKVGQKAKTLALNSCDDLKMLAGYVIVKNDEGNLVFSYKCFTNFAALPKDVMNLLNELRDQLMIENFDFQSLQSYKIQISGDYDTCEDGQDFADNDNEELQFERAKDWEIEQFFDRLIFVVNVPDGKKLAQKLDETAGAKMKINALDVDLVDSFLERNILHWISTNYDKFKKKLSGDKLVEWVKALDQQFEEQLIRGLRGAYPEKLTMMGYRFSQPDDDLKKFITGTEKKRILYANANDRLLVSSMVAQLLYESKSLLFSNVMEGDSNSIFVREKTILNQKEKILDIFSSSSDINILVIEGATMDSDIRKEQALARDIAKVLKEKKNKKVILVGESTGNLHKYLKERASKLFKKVSVELKGKKPSSQSMLRLSDIKVKLQGYEIKATDLLNDELHPANVRRVLHGDASIGGELPQTTDFTIPLTVSKNVNIKPEILKSQNELDNFAITDMDKKTMTKLISAGQKVRYYDEKIEDRDARFVILDSIKATTQFAELEAIFKNSGFNLHWLEYDSSRNIFIWKKTVGDTKGIKDYAAAPNPKFKSFLPEKEVFMEDRVAVIQGPSGSGKNQMTKKLALEMKNRQRGHWVVRIDLNQCTKALNDELEYRQLNKKSSFDPNNQNAVLDFVTNQMMRKNDFQIARLDMPIAKQFMKDGQFSVLLDGYGSLSSEGRKIIADVLPGFRKFGPQYIVATSTPDSSRALEGVLQVGSYRVDPLSENMKVELLAGLWSHNSAISGEIDYRGAASKLLGVLHKAFNDPRVTDRPAVIEIVSTVYANNIKQINSGEFEKIHSMDTYDLMNRYVRGEYMRYHKPGATSLTEIVGIEANRRSLENNYGKLALYYRADNTNLKKYFPGQIQEVQTYVKQVKNRSKQLEVLPKLINEKANFVSNTVEDYFHARFIANHIDSGNSHPAFISYIFENVLLQPNHESTRSFLNGYFSEIPIEKTTLLETYGKELNTIWKTDKTKLELDGHNIIHKAASDGHSNIVKFVIRCGRKYPEMLSGLIVEGKTPKGATPFHLAAQNLDSKTLKVLMDEYHSIEVFDGRFRTPLHYAVEGGNVENVKILLMSGANMHALDAESISPLQEAIIRGDVDILDEFTQRQDWKLHEDTTLHTAAEYGNFKVVKYLVENNLVEITKKDANGKSAIDYAHDNQHSEVENYLKGKSILETCFKTTSPTCRITKEDIHEVSFKPEDNIENIRIVDQKFWPKYYSLEATEREQFMQTLSEILYQGNWPEVLHGRNRQEVLDKIKRFRKHKALERFQDERSDRQIDLTGYTALHGLAEFGNIEGDQIPDSMTHLVNAVDIYGNTPLHYAADSGNEKTVDLLLKHGADVKLNRGNSSPLHFAAKGNNVEVVKKLMGAGASKFEENNYGDNPIQIAARVGDLTVLKHFVLTDSRVDYVSIKVHVAESGSKAKMQFLETKYSITREDAQMLNQAARYGHEHTVNYLIGKRIPIREDSFYNGALSGNGKVLEELGFRHAPKNVNWVTIIRNSIYSGNLDLVKTVANTKEGKKAIKATYFYNRNMLYEALESGQLKTAKWLVEVHKLDVKHVDEKGENLAHAAAKSGNLEGLKWIRSKGVDIYAKSKEGKTTLQSAVEAGNVAGADYLLRHNVPFSFDNKAKSPFDYGKVGGPEMINWLRYSNAALKLHDFSGLVTKKDWNSISDNQVDDIKYIKVNPDKLAKVLDNTPDLTKRLALLQIAEKYSNRKTLEQSDRLQGYLERHDMLKHLEVVQKFSDRFNLVLSGKNLVGDILDQDMAGFRGNSLNLGLTWLTSYISPKIAARGAKLIENGSKYSGYGLKVAAPFIGRATDAYVVIELIDKIDEYKKGNKDALVRIVGDSTVLVVDTAALAAELAASFGYVTGVASVMGPFAAALDIAIFVGMDIYDAVRSVQKIDEHVPLTGWEKFSTGVRAFFTAEPSQYIKDLVEIQAANTRLTNSSVIYLKAHKHFNKYVFASAYKNSTGNITLYPDNTFDFTHKKLLKWERTRPDTIDGGVNFCMPVGDFIPSDKPTYYCDYTIGVEVANGSKENNTVLIVTGDGHDVGHGFPNEGNIFVMSNGTKNIKGGYKNDIFFIGQSFISGNIDGKGGINTLDFEAYNGNELIYLNPSSHITTEKNNLHINSIQRLIGRTKKPEIFHVDCGVEVIESRGGTNAKNPDRITIRESNYKCNHNLVVNISPYTDVESRVYGDLLYYVRRGEGEVNMHFDYKSVGRTVKQSTIFANYTMNELVQINRKVNNHTLKATFTFEGEDNRQKLNLNLIVDNQLSLILKDQTVYQFNDTQLFALQRTNKSAIDILNDRGPIMQQKVLLMAESLTDKAFVTINAEDGKSWSHREEKDNLKLLPTNPAFDNYMIASEGPNIYEIVPPKPLTVPLKPVYIYNNSNNSAKGNTIYLQKLLRQLVEKLKINPRIQCKVANFDLILVVKNLEGQPIVTIELRAANLDDWYKKAEVIGVNAAMRIIKENKRCRLEPIPLHFDKNANYVVLTKEDFEANSRVELEKDSTGYEFYHLNDDLVITNRFSENIDKKQHFVFSLMHFFRYNESTLHTLQFKFNDDQFGIKEKLDVIKHAESFNDKLQGYAVSFKDFHSIKMSSPRGRRSVGNSASSFYSPINTLVGWIKQQANQITQYVTDSFRPKTDLIATETPEVQNLDPSTQFDVNQTLFLADFLIRKYTKSKPYNHLEAEINYGEVQAIAVDLVVKLETLVEEFSGKFSVDAEVEDPVKLQGDLVKKLVNADQGFVESLLMNAVKVVGVMKDEKLAYLRKDIRSMLQEVVRSGLTQQQPMKVTEGSDFSHPIQPISNAMVRSTKGGSSGALPSVDIAGYLMKS